MTFNRNKVEFHINCLHMGNFFYLNTSENMKLLEICLTFRKRNRMNSACEYQIFPYILFADMKIFDHVQRNSFLWFRQKN